MILINPINYIKSIENQQIIINIMDDCIRTQYDSEPRTYKPKTKSKRRKFNSTTNPPSNTRLKKILPRGKQKFLCKIGFVENLY